MLLGKVVEKKRHLVKVALNVWVLSTHQLEQHNEEKYLKGLP